MEGAQHGISKVGVEYSTPFGGEADEGDKHFF